MDADLTNLYMRFFNFFENLVEPFPDLNETPPPKQLLAFVWHFSRGFWPWLILMSVLTAVISVLEISLFGYLGNLVDWLSVKNPATFLAEESRTLLWMAIVILILIPLTGFVHSVILHQTVIGNYPMAVRWRAHRYMMGQSFGFFQDELAGRIATRVMQTSLAIRQSVMQILDVMVYVGVYFIGAIVLMSTFNIWLMIPYLIWFMGYVLLLRYFLPKLKKISRLQADTRSEMTGRIVDSYTNIMTVKLFAHAGRETAYAKDSMKLFLDTVHPQMRFVTLLTTSLGFLNGLLLFSVGAVSVKLWLSGLISVGGVAVGAGLVLRLQGMSHWVMWELSALFESIGITYDGMEMLSQHRDVQDAGAAQNLTAPKGSIEFEHVRFNYGKDSGVIDDLSLKIDVGEKIGLVGRSGAGKTTLTNVLLRLYDIEAGRILIDGTDIAEIRQESLRRHIGVVTQDTSLLHRSVFDNIAYGRQEATDAEVFTAAKRANAHEFILQLQDSKGRQGYAAHVGERGVKLSGGQRQRVAIARVFLKNAPILVLDEATSALDSEVEEAIQENLADLMEGKTVIAIAHRLSTIAAMDRLVVLDQGSIIEQGTHQQLITRGKLYAQLWARQSGGFLSEHDTDPAVE